MLKKLFFLSLVVFGIFAIVYIIDRVMFTNFGSIRSVKDASKVYKNIEELSDSCKVENISSVLVIHPYGDGRVQARCSDQFFPQTWDVSMFLP